jgi:hypothetical protein
MGEHSLSGSVLFGMLTQTPFEPQRWHTPLQDVLQHTPSTHGTPEGQITSLPQQVWPEPRHLVPQQETSCAQQAPPIPGHWWSGSAQRAWVTWPSRSSSAGVSSGALDAQL